jgi:hypothetical protein
MVDRVLDANIGARTVPSGTLVIASMDPAPVGGAAIVIYGILPPDGRGIRRRLVIDFEWGNNWRTDGTWDRIRQYSTMYHPRWWVFEVSATTKYFLQDRQLQDIARQYSFFVHEVGTGANKNYGDFAVSSLRDLFIGDPPQLILPALDNSSKEMSKILRDQLVDYHPDTTAPHDGPMALWFAERAIRDLGLLRNVSSVAGKKMSHWKDPYSQKFNQGSWSFKKPAATI